MKKQYHEINIQAIPSREQLQAKFKQNQSQISSLKASIKKKRDQMKQFSQQMTKVLEKKLIPKNESIYKHPNFTPNFHSKKLQDLYTQREAKYSQINEIKQKLSQLYAKEEPQVVAEIHKKQGAMQILNRQYTQLVRQKILIQEALNKNKEELEYYKQSQCLKQIQQNKQQMIYIKSEIKQIDQDIKNWASQEIRINIYSQKIANYIEEMENQITQTQVYFDQKQFQQLVSQINQIIQERKLTDRQYVTKKQEISKKIKQILQLNTQLQKNIREQTNKQLKSQLQKKKQIILAKNRSMPLIKKEQKPNNKKLSPQKQKQQILPLMILTQPPIKKPQVNHIKNQFLILGTWIAENHIKDDTLVTRNISRAICIKLKTKKNKIAAIGITYIDKQGVQLIGKGNIWKLQQQKLEEGEQQYNIDLQDVSSLTYFSPSSMKKNEAFSQIPIGLKFFMKSSKSQIVIGQFLNEEEVQCIDFEQNFIKTIQFTLDNNLKFISGLKLVLCKAKETNIQKQKGEGQKQIIKPSGNEQMMPSKWLSTASEAGLTQKKVYLKSSPNKKYLRQVPQVDHRLLLNRKKKMV